MNSYITIDGEMQYVFKIEYLTIKYKSEYFHV